MSSLGDEPLDSLASLTTMPIYTDEEEETLSTQYMVGSIPSKSCTLAIVPKTSSRYKNTNCSVPFLLDAL